MALSFLLSNSIFVNIQKGVVSPYNLIRLKGESIALLKAETHIYGLMVGRDELKMRERRVNQTYET